MNATIELENTYTSGVYSKRSVVIVRGSGALLWDDAGREYIDCTAGHGVANIGHGRPEIAAAARFIFNFGNSAGAIYFLARVLKQVVFALLVR